MYNKIILAMLFVVGLHVGPAQAEDSQGNADQKAQVTEQTDGKGMGCGCGHMMKKHKCGCPMDGKKGDCPRMHRGDCPYKKDCPMMKRDTQKKQKKEKKQDKKAEQTTDSGAKKAGDKKD